MSTPPTRRWQFSLRRAFVLLSIAAIIFALVGNHLRRLKAQEAAFSEIAKRGGAILVYDEGVFISFPAPKTTLGICGTGLIRTIGPTGVPTEFADKHIHYLHSVIDLSSINFRNTSVTTDGISQLREALPQSSVTK